MKIRLLLAFFSMLFMTMSFAKNESTDHAELKEQLLEYMDVGKIPGLSLMFIDKQNNTHLITLGKQNETPGENVKPETLFELGSTSKAFTGLIAAKLLEEGKIKPETTVSSVLPELSFYYEDKPVEVSFIQLLHHSSGVPFSSVDFIYGGSGHDSLAQMIKNIGRINLEDNPDTRYSYATINYDIAARMMEVVTQQPYSELLQDYVLTPLKMNDTSIDPAVRNKATGYQISYLAPRPYDAPFFISNIPAGYIQTNATDMEKWLRFLIEDNDSPLSQYKKRILEPNTKLPTNEGENVHYALGWSINNNKIYHTGMNPNFSSFVGFNTQSHVAVVVMANVNSNVPFTIGEQILQQLSAGNGLIKLTSANDIELFDTFDRLFLIVSAFLSLFSIWVAFRICRNIVNKDKRPLSAIKKFTVIILAFFCCSLIFLCFFFPAILLNMSWDSLIIWMPMSFILMLTLLMSTLVMSLINLLIIFFKHISYAKNQSPSL
ncbi:serine hydrolase domain-containing protein [Xenorhabdus nematophila]|uniref:serine hydrolase domain-containing protein n=1 Tax=Xenorhabdus nematophila TaxID=628 RepID=UPI000542F007|nr:Beta-lactamase class C involved in xenocoumacin synthesis [Xenorhabdus nematophila str. Anatoliense]CEE95819.1 Beta-lactamase class C involved in xenocoumacin synthesis [Xenorhabdus nematophila str. Anatoliense]